MEQGVAEVTEFVDEDGTGAVETTAAGKAVVEEVSSERRTLVKPVPSVEAGQEPGREVDGPDGGAGAAAGAEKEEEEKEEEEEAAVSEEELAALRLRAPAGLTTDELRYMLSRSVADCAAALPDISAAMDWAACPTRLGAAAAR